jgi:hypothetical protein
MSVVYIIYVIELLFIHINLDQVINYGTVIVSVAELLRLMAQWWESDGKVI